MGNFMPGFLQRNVTSDGSLDVVPLFPWRPKNYLEAIPKFVLGFLLPITHFHMCVSEEWRKQIIGIVLPHTWLSPSPPDGRLPLKPGVVENLV